MTDTSWLRRPLARGAILFGGLVALGFLAMFLGWRIAARSVLVTDQVPAGIAGGLAGLAAVVLGVGLANVQTSRHLAATERAATDALIDEARALVNALNPQEESA